MLPPDSFSRSSVASSTEPDDDYHQFVFLLLLDDDRRRLLMLEQDGERYVPFFEYSYRSGRHNARACLQLQKELGFDMNKQYFAAVYDTIDYLAPFSIHGKETSGYCSFLLVYSSCPNFSPQPPAAWHDIESVSQVAERMHGSRGPSNPVHQDIYKIALQFLRQEQSHSFSNDIRYRHGWFQKASQYFASTLAENGISTTEEVFQFSLSPSSTVLALDTERGRYFLKSPAAGCDELSITKAVSQNLPDSTLYVIDTNDSLNCFVSEPLEVLEDMDLGTERELGIMVSTLAKLQLDSMDHLDALETAGIPNRSPLAMSKEINRWLTKDSYMKSHMPGLLTDLAEHADAIKEALSMVHESGVPLTLVHGDVSEANIGKRKCEGGDDWWVFYDWQFAYISHPFFDLHRLYEHLPEAVIESYLTYWTEFAKMEELKILLPVACHLAWLFKAWNAIECAKACNPGLGSTMLELVIDCLDMTRFGLRKQTTAREGASAERSRTAHGLE